MGIRSKSELSFHLRLFLLLLGFSLIMVGCFITFQYNREKQFRIDRLDAQLQLYNVHLIRSFMRDSLDFRKVITNDSLPIEGLRVSVIGRNGKLLFDNSLDSLPGENHLDRHEIREALLYGQGHTTRRHSTSTSNTYFYSATRGEGIVVRSAVPYSFTLQELLKVDQSFLWFMAVVTIALSVAGYFLTRKIGKTITRLNEFAARAENGESISEIEAFPGDELGSISRHIIRLYGKLQQTMRQRDDQYRKALHEEKEKTRIKHQLTNNINHELKTPVASLKLCLETLQLHPDISKEKQRELIDKSVAQADRLANLLNDISAITRMNDGAEKIEMTHLDLQDIIKKTVAETSVQATNAGISVKVNIPQRIPIHGNRTFLESIFHNLIDNALAYSGGSELNVELSSQTAEEYTFRISDNGIGIPEEHRERIFERFYRIDKGRSRQMGGTGLGLSIVRNAIQLHGGKIRAEETHPHGVTFIFTLKRQ